MIVINPQGVTPEQIAFAPDGALLAASSNGLVLSMFDAFTGKLLWRTERQADRHRTGEIYFSPDGSAVSTAWELETPLDVKTGKPTMRPADQVPGGALWPITLPPPPPNSSVNYKPPLTSPDGRWSAVDFMMPLGLHDAKTNRTTDFYPHMAQSANEEQDFPLWGLHPLTFSPDGKLFVGRDKSRLHIFRCKDLIAIPPKKPRARYSNKPQVRAVATLESERKMFQTAAFTRDGSKLMTGTNDGLVRIWDTKTWQELTVYDWKTGPIRWIVAAADGTRAAAAGTRKIVVWDLDA